MNDMIVQQFGPLAKIFHSRPVENNLASGIQASFPILGFAGKAWQIRYRGEKHTLMRADGDGPVNSIEAVILKAAGVVSKTYYENSYVDGSVEAPDCFSTNGITPEQSSKKRQSTTCATCRHNAWGSRPPLKPGDPPRKGKACADTKRLAVVMGNQLQSGSSETMGAMLLRVPPASLQEVAMYGVGMARYGYPEYSILTRISFDTKEVFPKLLFNAVRALTEEEGAVVLALRDQEQTDRVLQEASEETAAAQPETVPASPFEQAPKSEAWVMGTATAPEAKASPAASQTPQTAPQPTVAPSQNTTIAVEPAVVVEDQPFVNTAGIASAVTAQNTQQPTNGASPPSNVVSETKKSFDEDLDDKLAALLPSLS